MAPRTPPSRSRFCGGLFSTQRLRTLLIAAFITSIVTLIIFRGPPSLTNLAYKQVVTVMSAGFASAHNHSSHAQKRSSTALIVVFDSTVMKATRDHAEIASRWFGGDSTLADCRGSVTAACHVYLIFYDDDVNFSTGSFYDGILRRVNQTLIDSKQNPKAGSAVSVLKVSNRKEDGRALSRLISDAYLLNAEYFQVIFSTQFERGFTQGATHRMQSSLLNASPSKTGVVLIEPASDTGVSIGGVLVSRVHVDIFGEFVPYRIPDIRTGLGFLASVYPKELVGRFVSGKALPTATTAMEQKWPAGVMEEAQKTLDRYLQAAKLTPCLRCDLKSSRKVIAMSLYGSSRRYTMGAVRNAQLFPVIFPGWRLWFYSERPQANGKVTYGAVPPEITAKAEELGAEIRYVDPAATGLAPMLWRFLVTEELDLDAFTIRDCDSRLTPRDAAVVADWLKTNKAFHCIRDHPSHSQFSVSGGLWGGRPAQLNAVFNGSLRAVMKRYGVGYVEDMNFLGRDVWPKVAKNHTICHDSFSCGSYASSHAFPVKREGYEHLGQVYDEHSIGRGGDIDILRSAAPNLKCIPA